MAIYEAEGNSRGQHVLLFIHIFRINIDSKSSWLKNLKDSVNSPIGGKFSNMVKNPKGEAKMSEALEIFAAPYLAEFKGYQGRSASKPLVELGFIASTQPR
ncbi:MAG: hypothetical protein QNJ46_05600 [Leptolyngbyaceae cyanobacterium MO_188.B28]|nr:hypothetical protein [Leptolyngbyaceae cyanobacterium MO_188.B28]